MSKAAWYGAAKRFVDLAFSGLLLIPALPLMLAAMLLVKLTSRGPAIYTQVRVGRDGEEFTIYKIRTMRNDCEKQTGPQWAAQTGRDPRATVIGDILRKTHIDELPQLLNVFKGDMTLVGPRPERPVFVAHLERAIPLYRDRLRTRPGVTGLAQVLLPPDSDFHGVRIKLMYDLFYLREASVWLDVRLIACTAFKVVGVPRPVSRKLLGIPCEAEIEAVYEAMIAAPETPSDEVVMAAVERPEVEMQPAF